MDINNHANSPAGTRFMVKDPGPEVDGREAWDKNLYYDYEHYLERLGNRSVLSGQKREDYRRWLRNPTSSLIGEGFQARQKDANTRTQALAHFELQDYQVYRKAETIRGHNYTARYAICTWDSFEIICAVHRGLKHFGISPFFQLAYPAFYPALPSSFNY